MCVCVPACAAVCLGVLCARTPSSVPVTVCLPVTVSLSSGLRVHTRLYLSACVCVCQRGRACCHECVSVCVCGRG